MSLMENVAYLKGLADGLGLDPGAKEGKLFAGIIDVLASVAIEIEDLSERALNFDEEISDIMEGIDDLKELFIEDHDDDDYFDFGDFDDDDDDDFECNCEHCEGHDFSLEAECPNCSETIILTEASISTGTAVCSSCGSEFDLEFDELYDDFEDDDEEVATEPEDIGKKQ